MRALPRKRVFAAAIAASILTACAANPPATQAPAAAGAGQPARVDRARIDMTLKGFIDRGERVGVSALVCDGAATPASAPAEWPTAKPKNRWRAIPSCRFSRDPCP